MAVDNLDTIDFISITTDDKIVLTISDHLKWNDEEHYLHLKNKINSYLEVIENNQIYEIYPDANNREIIIQLSLKHKPNNKGISFLDDITSHLKSKKYNFTFSIVK